jgi:hypothetical protein
LGDVGAAPGNLLLLYSACLVTPGSESGSNGHEGSPENLGDPVVSIVPAGARLTNSRKKRSRERVRIGNGIRIKIMIRNGIRIKIMIRIKMRRQQKKGPDTSWHPTRH